MACELAMGPAWRRSRAPRSASGASCSAHEIARQAGSPCSSSVTRAERAAPANATGIGQQRQSAPRAVCWCPPPKAASPPQRSYAALVWPASAERPARAPGLRLVGLAATGRHWHWRWRSSDSVCFEPSDSAAASSTGAAAAVAAAVLRGRRHRAASAGMRAGGFAGERTGATATWRPGGQEGRRAEAEGTGEASAWAQVTRRAAVVETEARGMLSRGEPGCRLRTQLALALATTLAVAVAAGQTVCLAGMPPKANGRAALSGGVGVGAAVSSGAGKPTPVEAMIGTRDTRTSLLDAAGG